jgi:hypothetical protein
MTSYSLAGGINASYAVAAGKTTILINSEARLNQRGVYVGTGQMIFHWVQEGKTQVWRCDISMLDPTPVQVVENVGQDGGLEMVVPLDNVYPAGLLLQGRMVGTLMAPAVHIDVPWGADFWVFLVRSPWFPAKLQMERSSLSVEHNTSRATASLGVMADGSVSAQVVLDGTDFKNASFGVKRTLGSYSSTEEVCNVGAGTQTFTWKPIMRVFDLVLVLKGGVSESQWSKIAQGVGADISSGLFGGSLEGDYVLCDGPAFSYRWSLKGHRGLLENQEDQISAKFAW